MAPLPGDEVSDQHVLGDGDGNDFVLAAVLLAVFFVCVVIVVAVCSCCRRHSAARCCRHNVLCACPCQKRDRGEDLAMGYLPANITVNSGALEQGVPDIFLRGDSQVGRISVDPYSYGNSSGGQNPDSPTETSGTWAEYLRRATLTRRGFADPVPDEGPPPSERGMPLGPEREEDGVINEVALALEVADDDDDDVVVNPSVQEDDVTLGAGVKRDVVK